MRMQLNVKDIVNKLKANLAKAIVPGSALAHLRLLESLDSKAFNKQLNILKGAIKILESKNVPSVEHDFDIVAYQKFCKKHKVPLFGEQIKVAKTTSTSRVPLGVQHRTKTPAWAQGTTLRPPSMKEAPLTRVDKLHKKLMLQKMAESRAGFSSTK